MNSHPELEQLSAFVDGELGEPERKALEEHVQGCAECRATLAGIRAAIGDLALLDQPVMDQAAVAALDARVAAERASRRVSARRIGWVAGAAAVLAVGLVTSLALLRQSPTDSGALNRGSDAGVGSLGAPLTEGATDYDEVSAQQALATVSANFAGSASTDVRALEAAPAQKDAGAYRAPGADDPERCAEQIEKDVAVRRVRFEAATYKGTPAFLLFYLRPPEEPTTAEVWVVRAADCFTLYFAQQRV